MEMLQCVNCGKRTGHKRALGFGTFFAVILTFGLWLLVLPFYPKRCTVCGETKRANMWAAMTPAQQRARAVGLLLIILLVVVYYAWNHFSPSPNSPPVPEATSHAGTSGTSPGAVNPRSPAETKAGSTWAVSFVGTESTETDVSVDAEALMTDRHTNEVEAALSGAKTLSIMGTADEIDVEFNTITMHPAGGCPNPEKNMIILNLHDGLRPALSQVHPGGMVMIFGRVAEAAKDTTPEGPACGYRLLVDGWGLARRVDRKADPTF